MARYMPHINAKNRETFEMEWAERQTYLEFARLEGIRKMAEQQKEMGNLRARIAEQQTKDEALAQSLILTLENTPQSIPNPRFIQSIPNPRAALPHLSQSIPNPTAAPSHLSQNIPAPQNDPLPPTAPYQRSESLRYRRSYEIWTRADKTQ